MNKLCGRKENFYSKTESNSLSSHEPVHSHNCVVQQGFHITTTWRESGKCSDLQTCKHGHDFDTQGMSPFFQRFTHFMHAVSDSNNWSLLFDY